MAELEGEDHKVTYQEREFWKSLTVVISHLSNRALAAEAEVKRLRAELAVKNEQVEYMTIQLAKDGDAPTIARTLGSNGTA